jgi:hypothetical protein
VMHARLGCQRQHGCELASETMLLLCNRNNLGGFDGALSQAQVADGVIITAPAIYNSSGAGRAGPLAALLAHSG